MGVRGGSSSSVESETLLRAVAHVAKDAIIVADAAGSIVFWNPAAETIFGHPAGEALGRPISVIIPERLREAHKAGFARFRRTGTSQLIGRTVELVGLRRDGTEFPIELSLSTGSGEDGPFFAAIIRDISRRQAELREREEAAAVLRASEAKYRQIVETAREGVAIVDASGRFTFVNSSLETILGYAPGEMIGLQVLDILDAEGRSLAQSNLARRRAGIAEGGEFRVLRKDGTETWIHFESSPLTDGSGTYTGFLSMVLDITDQRRAERQLAEQAEINQTIIENLPNGAVLMVDENLRYLMAAGPALPDMLRRARVPYDEIVGRQVEDVVSPEKAGEVLAVYRQAIAGRPYHGEIVRGDRFYDLNAVPIRISSGVTGAVVLCYDVTETKRTLTALAQKHALVEAMLTNIADGVALLNEERSLVLANVRYADIFGLSARDLVGLTRDKFLEHVSTRVADPSAFVARLNELSKSSESAADEFTFVRPVRRVLRRTVTPIPEVGTLVVWHDITAERDLIAQREQELFTDPLTGVPNRRAAEAALVREVGRARRSGVPFSVAMFDIDRFKQINDTHGHATGDEVLRRVAGVLAAEARGVDTVARWGGEEFLAVLGAPLEGARFFCERARAAIASTHFLKVERVTVSAGAAEVDFRQDPSEAIARADERLYEAKLAGRNCVKA